MLLKRSIVALTSLACAACMAVPVSGGPPAAASSGPAPAVDAALLGPEWLVEDLEGRGVVDRSRTTLAFMPDGGLAGTAGCNRYMTTVTAGGGRLAVGAVATTRRACLPALADQEQRFLRLLAAADRYAIDAQGALVLLAPDGGRILARREGAAPGPSGGDLPPETPR